MSQSIPAKRPRGRPRKAPDNPVERVPKSEPDVPAAPVSVLAPSTSQQTGGPTTVTTIPSKPDAKRRARLPQTVSGPSGEASASTSSKRAKKDTKPAIAQDGKVEVVKPKRKGKEKKEDPNAERFGRYV